MIILMSFLQIKPKHPAVADRLDEDDRAMFDIGRSSATGGGGDNNIVNDLYVAVPHTAMKILYVRK